MNPYITYDGMELWKEETWENHRSPAIQLINALYTRAEVTPVTLGFEPDPDPKASPEYRPKTGCIERAEVIREWDEKGLVFSCLEIGGRVWIQMRPKCSLGRRDKKVPFLIVPVREDIADPYYAMRVVERYRAYNETAAREQNCIILYMISDINTPGLDADYCLLCLTEAYALYPGDVDRALFDVSAVVSGGGKIGDIAGFTYTDLNGQPQDPDESIERFNGVPVLNLARRWNSRFPLNVTTVNGPALYEPDVNVEALLHSESGKSLVEGLKLEYQYKDPADPGLLAYWEQMGLKYEAHELDGSRWISMTPLCALQHPEKKLPVVLIFMEVTYTSEPGVVTALANYMSFLKVAAEGEFIAVFFALETVEDNDLMADICRAAARLYPVDMTRVYLVGHSHNSAFALGFARRFPTLVTAMTTLNWPAGLAVPRGGETAANTDEMVELMHTQDIPLINTGGYNEIRGGRNLIRTDENWALEWQRRLRSLNCPEPTAEEILNAANNGTPIERALRVPVEKGEIFFSEGFEHYIADFKNNEGRYHFRLLSVRDMPHMLTPTFAPFAWSFMRRFRRDPETGKIEELY